MAERFPRIGVFLSVRSAEALLRDLRVDAPIAVTICRPGSRISVQVKGQRALVGPIRPRVRAVIWASGAAFGDEIAGLGYSAMFAGRLSAPVEDEAVAVEFIAFGDKTELVLLHERFADAGARDRHEQGWQGCLESLPSVLAA
jgi:hypothetical protein